MKSLVAVGQMTSTEIVNDNFLACQRLTAQAAAQGAKLLCLPENF
jgi:predicted amidohydrolase